MKGCRKGVATKDRVSKVSSMCSGDSECIGEMVEVVKSEKMESPSPYVGRGCYVLYTGYKGMYANAMAARNASCCCVEER